MPHKWYKFDLGSGEKGKNSGKRIGGRKEVIFVTGFYGWNSNNFEYGT